MIVSTGRPSRSTSERCYLVQDAVREERKLRGFLVSTSRRRCSKVVISFHVLHEPIFMLFFQFSQSFIRQDLLSAQNCFLFFGDFDARPPARRLRLVMLLVRPYAIQICMRGFLVSRSYWRFRSIWYGAMIRLPQVLFWRILLVQTALVLDLHIRYHPTAWFCVRLTVSHGMKILVMISYLLMVECRVK